MLGYGTVRQLTSGAALRSERHTRLTNIIFFHLASLCSFKLAWPAFLCTFTEPSKHVSLTLHSMMRLCSCNVRSAEDAGRTFLQCMQQHHEASTTTRTRRADDPFTQAKTHNTYCNFKFVPPVTEQVILSNAYIRTTLILKRHASLCHNAANHFQSIAPVIEPISTLVERQNHIVIHTLT